MSAMYTCVFLFFFVVNSGEIIALMCGCGGGGGGGGGSA